ncbi:hypothetical protein GGI25_002516 [Coemansia spiralis]|uniref:Uncharacterized protein n=2 Tax=Coemansia TaxID=4863 RepID=A0A9W8KYD0_9FUNG|nr:hypothetical protein BX070DRAFT_265810 [Coemansia spiralis]KAJ2678165.1 hypothetical protein GGI25_002516 [Coemansia spiralis]
MEGSCEDSKRRPRPRGIKRGPYKKKRGLEAVVPTNNTDGFESTVFRSNAGEFANTNPLRVSTRGFEYTNPLRVSNEGFENTIPLRSNTREAESNKIENSNLHSCGFKRGLLPVVTPRTIPVSASRFDGWPGQRPPQDNNNKNKRSCSTSPVWSRHLGLFDKENQMRPSSAANAD